MACAGIGVLLFATSLFLYLRYAHDLVGAHRQERAHYALLLNRLWQVSFYGPFIVGMASLFTLGWGRWVGLAANFAAFNCCLMIIGAACGPFGCQ